MPLRSDLKKLLKPYFLYNILLSVSFVSLRKTPGLCNYLFNETECEFDGRETQILFFLLIVIMLRTRKSGSTSMINYLSSSFVYTKVANLILWISADLIMGIVFGIIIILGALLCPEPTYSGPDRVTYFRGATALDDELNSSNHNNNKKPYKYWLVTFYTVWNPTCVNFAPIFAQISTEFPHIGFGKVDVGRYPDAGRKYYVSDSSMSKQLPTVVLFECGKEVMRRPLVDGVKKQVRLFTFSHENVKNAFELVRREKEEETAKNAVPPSSVARAKKD